MKVFSDFYVGHNMVLKLIVNVNIERINSNHIRETYFIDWNRLRISRLNHIF